MAQGTNASAYRQLRPLENTNTGAIVEEHIRYWKKYKDEEEANQLAMEAKKRLYESQIAEKYDKAITDMSPSDVNRFYQDQVINTLEANKDEIADLAKRKVNGDSTAIMPYNAKKQQFADMAKMGNVIGGKLAELTKIKQSGEYNKVLNEPLAEMVDAMNSGMFSIDKKTLKHRIYSKDGKKVLFDGSSEELTNAFLSTGFNKPVNYLATGEEISKGIKLPDVNGNIQWTPETRRLAIISSASKLNNDPNLMETYKMENGINKPTEEMSPVEINTLATKFTDEFVVKGVAIKDNSLANQNTRSLMNERYLNRADKNEEKKNKATKSTTISLNTNSKLQPVRVTKDNGSIQKGAYEFAVDTSDEKNKLLGTDYTKVINWYLNPDNSIGYTSVIAKHDDKTDEWVDTKKSSSKANLTDDGLVVKNSGFNNVAELSKYLQSERDSKLGKTQATKKTIASGDIASKASAGGYTVAEYKKLLIANGIEIID